MIRPVSHIIAVLLLGMLAAPSLGAAAFAATADQPVSPASCHGHKAPASKAPVSYRCCVTGHHESIPVLAFSSVRPALAHFIQTADAEFFQPGISASSFAMLTTSPPGPSGLAPLRI